MSNCPVPTCPIRNILSGELKLGSTVESVAQLLFPEWRSWAPKRVPNSNVTWGTVSGENNNLPLLVGSFDIRCRMIPWICALFQSPRWKYPILAHDSYLYKGVNPSSNLSSSRGPLLCTLSPCGRGLLHFCHDTNPIFPISLTWQRSNHLVLITQSSNKQNPLNDADCPLSRGYHDVRNS